MAEKDEETPKWGEQADKVRKLTKDGEPVWVDKGSETEAEYLKRGWKGEGAGSKKPSEAPESPQSGDTSTAFAQELSTTSPSIGTEPTEEPGLPSPPDATNKATAAERKAARTPAKKGVK